MYIRIQSSLKTAARCLHLLPLQLELENFKWKVQFIYINNFRLSFIFWHPAGHRSWLYTLLMPPRKSSISSRRKETKQNCLFSPCAKRSQESPLSCRSCPYIPPKISSLSLAISWKLKIKFYFIPTQHTHVRLLHSNLALFVIQVGRSLFTFLSNDHIRVTKQKAESRPSESQVLFM